MASNDHQTIEAMKAAAKPQPTSPKFEVRNYSGLDLVLRLLLFSMTLVAVIVMVTSKQVKTFLFITRPAKFTYSSALVYFVVATSVTCLYSLVTVALSALSITKSCPAAKLLLYLTLMDSLMVGIVASATGAVSSIAYVGLHGNTHVEWMKVCDKYDKFCRHIGSSVALTLLASIVLLLLVTISALSLYHRAH